MSNFALIATKASYYPNTLYRPRDLHHRTHTRAQIRSPAIIDLPGIYPVVIQLHPQPSQPRIPPPSDAGGKRRKKFQLHKGRDTWRIAKGGEEGGIK